MGRPRKPPAEKQSKVTMTRLTPAERRQVEKAAKQAGKTIGQFMRDKALAS
jgi:uncharacterized protein (DUF1778 family)